MASFDDILGAEYGAESRSHALVGPKSTPQSSTPASPTQTVGSAATNTAESSVAPADPPRMSYAEMYEKMNPNKPETADERTKREKKEKRDAIFSALGDGISALSNLWFTSQYAPNSFDASKGMSATTKDRWEKLRRERDANSRQYFDGYMRALAMDDANNKDDRNWRHTIEREKIADERYEVKAEREKALADLEEKLKNHQITTAEYRAEQERIKAAYAEDTEKLKQDNLKAGIQQKKAAAGAANASAKASLAKADSYSNGGTGGKGKKYTLTIGKETYTYGSKEDYERAVERYASQYGVKPYVAYPDGKDNLGRTKHTTKRKSIAQIAAEVENKSGAKPTQQEDDFSQYEVRDDDEDDDEDFSQYEQ